MRSPGLSRGRGRITALATAAAVTTLAAVAAAVIVTPASAATLFSADFESGTSGWSKSGGEWTVVTDGSKALQQTSTGTEKARQFAGSTSWTNYSVQGRVKPLAFGSGGVAALAARVSGSTRMYRLALTGTNRVELQYMNGSTVTVLAAASRTITTGTWYTLRIDTNASSISGYIDGTLVGTASSSAITAGRIGLFTGYASARFDDVTVNDLVTTPPTSTPPTSTPPTSPPPTSPPPSDAIVVAADGSGQHRTVQAAVDAAPADSTSAVTIAIKPGTYRGVLSVPSNKTNLHLVGMGGAPGDVVIVENHSAGTAKPDGSTYGTNGSATALVTGPGFTAINLTIANDFDEVTHAAQPGHQAVALYLNADRSTLSNVRLLGDQDTFLIGAKARTYVHDSYIEGTVDFIFGDGIAVIHRSQIHEKRPTGGPITAAKTPASRMYGFLFYRSNLTSSASAGSSTLGRPWGPDAQVLYRECTLDAHIDTAQPWTNMSSNTWQNARFSEYRNTGPGAGTGSNRPQLTDAQAADYTPQRYLAGTDGWNPVA